MYVVFALTTNINITKAQTCSGSWAQTQLISFDCLIDAQYIGSFNGNLATCPVNPAYVPNQTNTFTFDNAVSSFSIDFNAFSGADCARLEVKINGVFYHLTPANFVEFPPALGCAAIFSNMSVTADGYLTGIPNVPINLDAGGRIIITNVNATSVTLSTNDVAGSVYSSPFNCLTIIPVKLESFLGTNTSNCQATFKWKTGTESNLKNIELLRSVNGFLFSKVADIKPKGSNSNYVIKINNYDDAFFKLKFIDLDGHYEYSPTIIVKSTCTKNIYSISINPVHTFLEVTGFQKNDRIFVLDMLGRTILTSDAPLDNISKFNVEKLSSGIYYLQVVNSGVIKTNIKFVKN
jgi:hypothetical protein